MFRRLTLIWCSFKTALPRLATRSDPILDGEDAGRRGAIGSDADGDETGVGEKQRAEAGAVLAGGAADGGVDGLDQVVKGGGGRAAPGAGV